MNPIPGYSRLRASADGHVWLIKARGKTYETPKRISGRLTKCGYLFCGVIADKDCDERIASPGRNGQLVHILVCLAFHGIRPTPGHEVDHINRDKTDNRPGNLRWVTRKENCANRTFSTYGDIHGMSKLTEDKVREIRRLREEDGKTLKEIGAMMGVHLATIHRIAHGRAWRRVV